jgi:hypothetical protein
MEEEERRLLFHDSWKMKIAENEELRYGIVGHVGQLSFVNCSTFKI